MDHKYIDEFDIVDRYLARRLAEGETAEFEEHFVDCLECIGRLEATKAFVDGLRRVASGRAAAGTDRSNEILEDERSTVSRKAFAAAAGALSVVIIAVAVFAFAQVRRYRSEADQARNASTDWERRYEEEHQLSGTAEKQRRESESELTEQIAQLRTQLERKPEEEPAKTAEVNVAILALSATRGNDASSGTLNEIFLPRSSRSLFLSVQLEGERDFKTYRMTIESSQRQPIFKGGGFRPNAYNSLSVSLSSTLFRGGKYLLTVDGVARDGSTNMVGQYSFRVRK
ncbi:MAG TPA: hypothetical protein VN937_25635 [Blastocatellia bacterium]|nr:hypothetical protein [Blastocatellia bacterium]